MFSVIVFDQTIDVLLLSESGHLLHPIFSAGIFLLDLCLQAQNTLNEAC